MPLTLRIQTSGEPEAPPRAVVVRAFPATIGRGARCKVCLDDESVSTLHAVLTREGDSYLVRDAESLNGTVVGGLRVARDAVRQLSDGDVLRVGRFWLQVHLEATALAGDLNTRDLALGLVSKVLHLSPDEQALRVVEGQRRGQLVVLPDGEEIALGRDEQSLVKLEGAQVSREHLRVTRRGPSVFVRDGGSRNGSSLGGAPLTPGDDVPWPPVAHLRMGNVVIALCGQRPPLGTLLGVDEEIAPSDNATVPPRSPSEVEDVPAPPAEAPSQGEIPLTVDSVASVDGHESASRISKAPATRAVSMSDEIFDPTVERQRPNVSMLLPAIALLVLLACIVGIAWLITT